MSYTNWESDVEFYESSQEGLVPIVKKHITEVSLNTDRLTQDGLITYKARGNRRVSMRILGFSAMGPVVRTDVLTESGLAMRPTGTVLGCKHPEENVLFPGILRTFYPPVIEYAEETAMLPTPIRNLRVDY